jgi:hypothetical protein
MKKRLLSACLGRLAVAGGVLLVPAVSAQITATYLPPGAATPTYPFWSLPHRDIPWWFGDNNGPSDAYDVSVQWAARYNAGGTAGYEAGIISPASPLGNQGIYSSNQDRTWTSGTAYPFTISYAWTGATTAGPGAASLTINGATSTANTGYVTDRVAAFVNATQPAQGAATGPYRETHQQRDLLLRLGTIVPGSGTVSITLANLQIAINGGTPQNISYQNGGTQTSLTVTGTAGDSLRSIGFLFLDDVFANYTDDFVLTGDLTYTLSGGGAANGSGLLFEAKLGDLNFNPVPEPTTYAAVGLSAALLGASCWRPRRPRA